MARKGYLITQYFARLLDISEEEDRRLIFAEGFADEELALDLLATNATDTEASEVFFDDPTFMHSDVLSTATEEYLDELFDRGISPNFRRIFVILQRKMFMRRLRRFS